ncbi:anti-anti-sigma factor [Bacillus sp. UMB0728]|nr:anti-anti-sigma factor [Bacillus sp. UMB0728]
MLGELMTRELAHIGERINQEKMQIAKQVQTERFADLTAIEREEISKYETEILNLRASFISMFGDSLIKSSEGEEVTDVFENWGAETGKNLCVQGVSLDEALMDTALYRKYIWKVIKKEVLKNELSAETVFEIIETIDPLLDIAVHAFSLAYVKSYTETLNNSKKAFLELSVPVVPITDSVAILPLIGDIDTDRAQLLMEETLEKSRELGISHLILDVSGVMIVDTMVANELFKVTDALRLLGIKVIFTGIRPEIAQTMVNLGLEVDGLVFLGSLKKALTHLNKQDVL